MSGKMSSKTTTRLQARLELCRARVRATARRHSRRIVANNWLSDRESMFPQLHYVLLALVLLTASSLSVKAQVNTSEKPTSATTSSVVDQPALPNRIPMIAAGYVAPEKQPPSLERVGVNDGDSLPLSLNEAIRLALENNNDIRASRIDVEMAEHDLTASRGAYDPKLFSESYFERQSIPVASFFGGSNGNSLKVNNATSQIGLSGLAPKYGGSYELNMSSTRYSSNNFFNTLNPAVSSQLSFTYTQPLVRGLRTDDARRRIEIAKKNLTLTDVQFRQKATEIITNVEQAYWELVNALKTLQVQIEAVKQSRAQVETNKRQVAQGVLAPIDVVEAEAQVKNFEQNVYSAQEQVTRAENTLKTLMLPDRKADLWSRALLPTTPVALEAPRVLLSEAINAALENRMELAQLRTSAEINQIDQKFYRDRTKPQVDLELSYSSNGYAGSVSDNTNPLITDMTALQNRIAELSSIAGLPPVQTNTLSPTVPANMQGGYGQSLSNMLGQDNPTVKVGVKISLPLKNRTAKAELGHSLAEGRRIDTQRAQTEQMIEADVRNAMQSVRSVEARLAAAAAQRLAADQQYTSEQRKFQAGMSTVYLVLQRQTDLVVARGKELQAQTDLNKAIADFQRAIGNTFRYRNVAVISDGLRLEQTENSAGER
ncbi:MAG TPA: TolC family protein [Pyrinomonadaceae bacterium]